MSTVGGPGFDLRRSASGGSRTIKAAGELDSGTCVLLFEAFEQAIADPRAEEVSLDLRDVSFIDSSGMRAMIEMERIASDRGVPLAVVPPPDDVTELLRTAGIAERMNLVFDIEEAPLGPDFLDRIAIELDRDPVAPSRARTEVRDALAGRLDESDIATVVLLTSELVTNAVVHPKIEDESTVGLQIFVYETGTRVEVEDPGEGFDPVVPSTAPAQLGGRGLFLVDRCSASWGARPTEGERGRRFCVWFEFLGGDREVAAMPG